MSERRLVTVAVTFQLLERLLHGEVPCDMEVGSSLPPDARVVGFESDALPDEDRVFLIVASGYFEPVPAGHPIPELGVTFMTHLEHPIR